MPAKTAIFCVMLIFGVLAAGACGSDDSEPGLPSRTQALIIADTASERCGEPVGEPSLSECWLASVKSQCARFVGEGKADYYYNSCESEARRWSDERLATGG